MATSTPLASSSLSSVAVEAACELTMIGEVRNARAEKLYNPGGG